MIRRTAIKRPQGACIDCKDGKVKVLYAAGRCQYHYWAARNKGKDKKGSTRNRKFPVPRETSGALTAWYQYWMGHYSGNMCEECGQKINEFLDLKGLHAAQAHILPKAKNQFPSVATVLENHMTLGARCGCHSRFDKSWESAQKMWVWPRAVERFRSFCHLIHPDEVRKLPEVLRIIYQEVMCG